jgi:hypothetical protein
MARARRICAKPGCPSVATSSFCPTHQAEAEKKRGNANARGYGYQHQKMRAGIVKRIEAGETVRCVDCRTPLTAASLDLGHTDDRRGYKGAQCSTCNRSDGGRRAHL